MAVTTSASWRKLPVTLTELCLDTTLRCGQAFRWTKIEDTWHMALHGRLISLKQDQSHLYYKATWPSTRTTTTATTANLITALPTPPSEPCQDDGSTPPPPPGVEDDTEALLRHYFSLEQSGEALYKQWAATDANFRKKADRFPGIRILNQDAWECLVGFICSSNNNIKRIMQMVSSLCTTYGPLIHRTPAHTFHDFPPATSLCHPGTEPRLRALGFGYRAKYIVATAAHLTSSVPPNWLTNLSRHPVRLPGRLDSDKPVIRPTTTYRSVHAKLQTLPGVGPKVADCVCLMGLGWSEAVPVDVHVARIAERDYGFRGPKGAALTGARYQELGEFFRERWGRYAGWAQSVVFTADLKSLGAGAGAEEKGVAMAGVVKEEMSEGVAVGKEKEKGKGKGKGRKRKVMIATTAVVGPSRVETSEEMHDPQVAEVVVSTRRSKRLRRG